MNLRPFDSLNFNRATELNSPKRSLGLFGESNRVAFDFKLNLEEGNHFNPESQEGYRFELSSLQELGDEFQAINDDQNSTLEQKSLRKYDAIEKAVNDLGHIPLKAVSSTFRFVKQDRKEFIYNSTEINSLGKEEKKVYAGEIKKAKDQGYEVKTLPGGDLKSTISSGFGGRTKAKISKMFSEKFNEGNKEYKSLLGFNLNLDGKKQDSKIHQENISNLAFLDGFGADLKNIDDNQDLTAEEKSRLKESRVDHLLNNMGKAPGKIFNGTFKFVNDVKKEVLYNASKIAHLSHEERKAHEDEVKEAIEKGYEVKVLPKEEFRKEVLREELLGENGFEMIEKLKEHYQAAIIRFEARKLPANEKNPVIHKIFLKSHAPLPKLRGRVQEDKEIPEKQKAILPIVKKITDALFTIELTDFALKIAEAHEEQRKEFSKMQEDTQIEVQEDRRELLKEEVAGRATLESSLKKGMSQQASLKERSHEFEDVVHTVEAHANGSVEEKSEKVEIKKPVSRHET
jgi:hypothetical protein